jgi:ribosomal protein L9
VIVVLDKWFKEDLNNLYQRVDKIVLIDTEENYDFLVEKIDSEMDITVHKVDDFLSDLEVKYQVEKNNESNIKKIVSTIKELDGKKVVIKRPANEKGHLFSAVHIDDVLEVISKQLNKEIDASIVSGFENTKEVGEMILTLGIEKLKGTLVLSIESE